MPPVVRSSGEDALSLMEDELLRAWRFERYVQLGVDLQAAASLAAARVDWHAIDALIRAGCPAELAARIAL